MENMNKWNRDELSCNQNKNKTKHNKAVCVFKGQEGATFDEVREPNVFLQVFITVCVAVSMHLNICMGKILHWDAYTNQYIL